MMIDAFADLSRNLSPTTVIGERLTMTLQQAFKKALNGVYNDKQVQKKGDELLFGTYQYKPWTIQTLDKLTLDSINHGQYKPWTLLSMGSTNFGQVQTVDSTTHGQNKPWTVLSMGITNSGQVQTVDSTTPLQQYYPWTVQIQHSTTHGQYKCWTGKSPGQV